MDTLTAIFILLIIFALRFLLPFGLMMLIDQFNKRFAQNGT